MIKGTPVESDRGLSNAQLAELLAQEAADGSGIRVRAFRRAARSAFLWPERAIDLLASGRDLSELHAVGPFIAKQLCSWIEKPPRAIDKPPALRRDFLTMADAKAILAAQPERGKMLRGKHSAILPHCAIRTFKFSVIRAAAYTIIGLGLKADWSRVFAEATKLNKTLEIDCYPDRQDLNVALLKLAQREGTKISLGTDAHHPWQLYFIELGLAAALKAKIPAERIINFMSLGELRTWVTKLRLQSGW